VIDRALQPHSALLWPAVLCGVMASLLLLVDHADQLLVGVVGALLLGVFVAVRERRLWTLCLTDPLTGLSNRRGFLQRFQKNLARVRREGESMALVLVDCDRFKQINDQFGHAAGDRALKLLAHSLQSAVRGDDLVARWGGDEFVVMLRDVDEEQVRQVAMRVGQLLEAPAGLPPGLSLTVSFGCVVRQPTEVANARLSRLLSAADTAMYEAKRSGSGKFAAWSDSRARDLKPFDFDQATPPAPA
jgi:diguanylate cyclase (GGDEF)-like protein